MNNRKTQVVSVRLDRWMVEGIDMLPDTNRTDYLKELVSADLRRQGINPAVVYARTSRRAAESHE